MGKYGKVTDTEIKWSIISESVMIIIFAVYIDQLIDYPINRASLIDYNCELAVKCSFYNWKGHYL